MTERVLVTGGCGFVGANLVPRLLEAGHEVRVLDDFRTGRREYLDGLEVDVIQGDICDEQTVVKVMQDVDSVVHLAAAGSVIDSVADPTANFQTNAVGTFTVLNGARQASVERMVFSSTGGALIGNATPPVNERSLPKPISPYGASKLAAEAYCHAFAKSFDIRTIALRFANVYGPYSGHKKGAISVFFKALHTGQPIVIYGDGQASRDFMYVADICNGIQRALTADVAGGTVIHLATGVETSVRELAEACRRVTGRPSHSIEYRPKRVGEVERNFATFDLAHELLGFTPSVSLEAGLAETWEWYQRHVLSTA